MGWMAPKLNKRIQIQKGVQTENDDYGNFDITYETLVTVWAGIKVKTGLQNYVEIIRGESNTDYPTHEFTIRWSAVGFLIGKEFGKAFSTGFDSIPDLESIKSNMFIFVNEGSSSKGRLFRVVDMRRDEDRKEFITFRAKQVEEQGTGYPE